MRIGVLLVLALAGFPLSAPAQEVETVPLRTVEAREALAGVKWEELESGLHALRAMTAGGLDLTAIRLSPEKFSLALSVQEKPEGERVETLGEREGAVVAVNGGFFGEKENGGALFPVGLLRRQGRNHSAAWKTSGGFLVLSPDRAWIRPSRDMAPEGESDIIQSKPVLIEPGGKWAMNSNQGHLRKRTLICLARDGQITLLIVTRAGLSLFEAGWLMRGPQEGGFFDCDAALALDGGGSTQVWVAGRDDLSFEGETPVHNALVVKRR